MSIAGKVYVAASLVTLAACSPQRNEITRLVSADQTTTAIVIREDSGGGPGDTYFYLYIVNATGDQELDEPSLTVEHCGGILPAWKDGSLLTVAYDRNCYIKKFNNRWYDPSATRDDRSIPRQVEIVLIRTEERPSSPSD